MTDSPGSNGIVLPSYVKVGMSVIALPADHVQGAKGRDDVAQHPAGDELREAAGDLVARRTNADAVRRAGSVAHEVVTELSVAAFGVRVALAGRHLRAFHDQLEVLNR